MYLTFLIGQIVFRVCMFAVVLLSVSTAITLLQGRQGDFRVAFCLCFKASPSAKHFIRKLVLFTCKWTKIFVWIKLISIWKASHSDSLSNRGEMQLGNRLFHSYGTLCVIAGERYFLGNRTWCGFVLVWQLKWKLSMRKKKLLIKVTRSQMAKSIYS